MSTTAVTLHDGGLAPDWPRDGHIDLERHDLPHRSSAIEWWYFNAHVNAGGNDCSLFGCFFRFQKVKAGKLVTHHAVHFAIADVASGKFRQVSLLDHDSPEEFRDYLESQADAGTPFDRLQRRLLIEQFARGVVPGPDRCASAPAEVADDRLFIRMDDACLEKTGDSYRLLMGGDAMQSDGIGFDLTFHPRSPRPVRHGVDGMTKLGPHHNSMFYYFRPDCVVEGTMWQDGEQHPVDGRGWYDHEFGGTIGEAADERDVGWSWLSIQLDEPVDDVHCLSTYLLTEACQETELLDCVLIAVDGDSRDVLRTQNFSLTWDRESLWKSIRTFVDYPTAWRLKHAADGLQVDLRAEAEIANQEVTSLLSHPAYWEGRMRVTGTINGKPVSGLGFLERRGYAQFDTMKGYLASVSEMVLEGLDELVPREPTQDELVDLVASEEFGDWVDPASREVLQHSVIAPIRSITDRGGKAWRSLGAVLACELVGGDPAVTERWIAVPELMHVGSLIVDDIQDQSTQRRGGPCAHRVYGVPQCINAGTMAYFIAERAIRRLDLTERQRSRLYYLYVLCLRSAHAGQALDIHGLHHLLGPAAEAPVHADRLEVALENVHLLKSGVPAGTAARMGAIIGGGSDEQVEAVGRFYERLGLAFQIMDDVLTMELDPACEDGTLLKEHGEDIRQGKLTMPLIALLRHASPRDARRVVSILQRHHAASAAGNVALERDALLEVDPAEVAYVTEMVCSRRIVPAPLERITALEYCRRKARGIIDDAWRDLDAVLPPTIATVQLRLFSEYVLERHY